MAVATTFDALVARSASFDRLFPTEANRISRLVARAPGPEREAVRAQIEADARGTRVLVHERVWALAGAFLAHKLAHGTAAERHVYAGMTPAAWLQRLIRKRPLVFMGKADSTLLRDGATRPPRPATAAWDAVGTEAPSTHSTPSELSLREYLSYDEIQVSMLVGASTPTFFINSGDRRNSAVPGVPETFENHGIYLGLVGARFEREWRAEDEFVVVRSTAAAQDAARRGCLLPHRALEGEAGAASRDRMWAALYGVDALRPPDLIEAIDAAAASLAAKQPMDGAVQRTLEKHQIVPMAAGCFFSVRLYKQRIRITIELLLLEANARAIEAQRRAYVHVVGLGLGVWEVLSEQMAWFLDVFSAVIDELMLPAIDIIDFSWFRNHDRCGSTVSGAVRESHNGNRIKIVFSKREPAAKLSDPSLLLIASYAWDGNSFPGNEYWKGSLAGSGDPAAACCSTIAELQNPEINDFTGNIAVLCIGADGTPIVRTPSADGQHLEGTSPV
ncbi:hypothetical protein HK105_202713 [Polyrhizophydium stewartii]|uniref:Uncharacterized protein n=1 Tax=Polyrhizophydium stewartii TaxID=2732419 RepID=A0ABR4NE70_9FUNG|nr:hypothetical protein HK105_007549 [Polyrhizophydium stewartii]